MTAPRLTILVSGMIAGVPRQGGATWAVLQYALGLQQLGHTVYLVEPLTDAAIQPAGATLTHSANAAYFRQVMRQFGLTRQAALLLTGTQQTAGLPYGDLRRATQRADVLINIAGMLADDTLIGHIPVRLYLDLDPAFTQLWQEAQHIDMRFAGHTHLATVGLAIGQPQCPVPTCGHTWITTPQPVALAHWPVRGGRTHNAFTTIANWRGYGSIEHNGVFYGQKAHSLRRFMALPLLTREQLTLALAIHQDERKDLEALAENHWRLLDPARVAGTPSAYRRFIRGSKAELGIAKSGYVAARCGWFSDRSVCYLASGRPVLAQDTGFTPFVPTGAGVLSFSTMEEVLAGIDSIVNDYKHQAATARAIAEEYFDSGKVLTRLLRRVNALP